MKYVEIASAIRRTDCYAGDSCDQLEPEWDCYFEGDKDSEVFKEPLTLEANNFPPGTRIIIAVPVCPCCEDTKENQQDYCKFDWDNWELNEYS